MTRAAHALATLAVLALTAAAVLANGATVPDRTGDPAVQAAGRSHGTGAQAQRVSRSHGTRARSQATGARSHGSAAQLQPASGSLGDPAHGVTGTLPAGWRLARQPATALSYPVELFTAATFPIALGGNCGPDRAVRHMPPRGVLVFAMEYRPARGRVSLRGFPPRPAHLRLRTSTLGTYECIGGPSYLLRFRDHGRPIQIHVALGPRASARRRAQALRFLDSLRFQPLPPPPPDPYNGWPRAIDDAGDSFRAPPGWASAVLDVPLLAPRPRTLFTAASRPLPGLPATRRPAHRLRLPAPTPPPAGVSQVWIVERPPADADAGHPPFRRDVPWPQPSDLAPTGNGLLRAGASCGGHRFEAWITGPPGAPGTALALQSAQGTAVSCGVRERQLRLAREPYLGVRCRTPNSIACDAVGLAVWLRTRAVRLRATIGGRTFTLRHLGHGMWQGKLHPAGLTDPSSPLHVTLDRPPAYWAGRHPVDAIVRIDGRLPDGQVAARRLRLPLHPGWG